VNEKGITRVTPPGSQNPRLYCKACGDYLAEDVNRTLGAVALPIHLAPEGEVRGLGVEVSWGGGGGEKGFGGGKWG
jgi:hypothetical protein